MKKFMLMISIMLLIMVSFWYFLDSKAIYASSSVFINSMFNKSLSPARIIPVKREKARDIKIPDDASENTAYSQDSSKKNIDFTNDRDVVVIPWKGPKLVVVDPGHGGTDPGAVINGLVEKDIALDVSERVCLILKDNNILTLLTRKDDINIEPRERIEYANRKEAALFVSIHSNWFEDPSLHGTMTLYNPSAKLRAGYLSEIDFAAAMQSEIVNKLETKDRGIIDRPNLAVLRHAKMPSVLVEVGFMSNKDDAWLLSLEAYRQSSAEGIANGIIKSLSKIDK